MTPTISSLLSRVRAASGPDRELDADIWQALCWKHHWREIAKGTPFTGSIDAAVALVERVLPGCSLTILRDWGGLNRCRIWTDDITPAPPYVGTASSLPLAILAALLSALEQKDRR